MSDWDVLLDGTATTTHQTLREAERTARRLAKTPVGRACLDDGGCIEVRKVIVSGPAIVEDAGP